MLVPRTALAAPHGVSRHSSQAPHEPPGASLVLDVALDAAGRLHGQVVDPNGRPLAQTAVGVRHHEQRIAATVTDANGYFVLAGLRGGIYQVDAAGVQATWRVWAPQTAPPLAQSAALIVGGSSVMRGQGAARRFIVPTLLVGAVIATAIAVPIAVSNANNDGS
jgi:hypothetical protein